MQVKFRKMLKRSDMENDTKDNVSPEQSEAEGTPTDSIGVDQLQQVLAEKDKELTELKDKYLRVLADSENARKRIRQQSEESVRMQRENFLRDLLPVVDNLERAVDAARGGGNGQPIVEGVEMVLRLLLDFLKTAGVTQVASVGQPFDPQRHEAVDQVHSPQHPPNTVVSEFHRGYSIGDRTLRTARVAVAKGTTGGSHGGNGGASGNGIENN